MPMDLCALGGLGAVMANYVGRLPEPVPAISGVGPSG